MNNMMIDKINSDLQNRDMDVIILETIHEVNEIHKIINDPMYDKINIETADRVLRLLRTLRMGIDVRVRKEARL